MRTPGECRRSRSLMRGSCEGCRRSAPVVGPSFRDGALAPDPESRDSGFDASHRPGMTGYDSAFPRRDAPEFCKIIRPKKTEGAGNAGCPMHPQPRVRNKTKHTSVVTTGTPE